MNFRTLIEQQCYKDTINYNHKLFFIGSCFAENISARLKDLKFDVTANPFGNVYNPSSLIYIVETIILNREIDDCFVVENDGLWYSTLHSTKIYADTKEELKLILKIITLQAHEKLVSSDKIFITLGTSWVYTHIKTGEIVNNCLKLPAKEFVRTKLNPEQIINSFKALFEKHEMLKSKTIYFTVSPIRHFKDGFVENSLSKATLVVAANALRESLDYVEYFPAYEIINDELRDYRFYAEDMIHPSSLAIDYVFDKFCEWCLDKESQTFCRDNKNLLLAVKHRPIKSDDPKYTDFCRAMVNKIENLTRKYKTISYICEIDFFNRKISQQ